MLFILKRFASCFVLRNRTVNYTLLASLLVLISVFSRTADSIWGSPVVLARRSSYVSQSAGHDGARSANQCWSEAHKARSG